MSVLKALARDWLPPVLARWFRQVRGGGIRFEGDFATWAEANRHCTGYDAEEILAKVLASTLKVKHGEAATERDSVLFDQIEYAWPVLAGLMWAAARTGGRRRCPRRARGWSYRSQCGPGTPSPSDPSGEA